MRRDVERLLDPKGEGVEEKYPNLEGIIKDVIENGLSKQFVTVTS